MNAPHRASVAAEAIDIGLVAAILACLSFLAVRVRRAWRLWRLRRAWLREPVTREQDREEP